MFKTVFAIIVKIKLKLNHKSKTVLDGDTIHNKYKNKSSNIVAQTLYWIKHLFLIELRLYSN